MKTIRDMLENGEVFEDFKPATDVVESESSDVNEFHTEQLHRIGSRIQHLAEYADVTFKSQADIDTLCDKLLAVLNG